MIMCGTAVKTIFHNPASVRHKTQGATHDSETTQAVGSHFTCVEGLKLSCAMALASSTPSVTLVGYNDFCGALWGQWSCDIQHHAQALPDMVRRRNDGRWPCIASRAHTVR
jgi:hypothetical protein